MNNRSLILIILLTTGIGISWYIFKKKKEPSGLGSTLIVGTNAEYPPFAFIKDDKIVGFEIDLINEISKRMGKTLQIQDMPFDALIPATQIGKVHMIIGGITPTPERAKRLVLTKPYLSGDPLLILSLAKNPLIKSVEDLKNKSVVVNEGYTSDFYMSSIAGPSLTRLATPAEAFLALTSGRADAFVAAQSSVQSFFDRYGKDNFNIMNIPDTADSYALGIAPAYPDLAKQVQGVLDEISEDGTLHALKDRWKIS